MLFEKCLIVPNSNTGYKCPESQEPDINFSCGHWRQEQTTFIGSMRQCTEQNRKWRINIFYHVLYKASEYQFFCSSYQCCHQHKQMKGLRERGLFPDTCGRALKGELLSIYLRSSRERLIFAEAGVVDYSSKIGK